MKVNLSCPNILACVALHWSMGTLAAATRLENTAPFFPQQLTVTSRSTARAGILCLPPLHAGIGTRLIFSALFSSLILRSMEGSWGYLLCGFRSMAMLITGAQHTLV